jgi:S-adenosylmethionine synthetase
MTVELFLTQASDLRPHFTIPAVARGVGHPDEIARGMAEAAAAALEEEGSRAGVPHTVFSLGSTLLLPGIAVPRFGGGRTGQPMRAYFAGTGPSLPQRTHAELGEVAHAAAMKWASDHLRFVDPVRHIATELFARNPGIVRTPSLAVARAPLAASQYLASETVGVLSSEEFRKAFPEVGDDVEASALATGPRLRLHVAIAFVDRQVHSARSYFSKKQEIQQYVLDKIRALPTDFDSIEILVNEDDVEGKEEAGCLLTVLGTTADGRRPGRAGAAPEGETTSVHAQQFAKMILARIRGVRAAVVRLEEDDGGEIRRAFVRLELEEGTTLEGVRSSVLELLPLREKPSRSIDPNLFT